MVLFCDSRSPRGATQGKVSIGCYDTNMYCLVKSTTGSRPTFRSCTAGWACSRPPSPGLLHVAGEPEPRPLDSPRPPHALSVQTLRTRRCRKFLGTPIPAPAASYGLASDHSGLPISLGRVRLPIKAAIPCALAVNGLVLNGLELGLPRHRSGRITATLIYKVTTGSADRQWHRLRRYCQVQYQPVNDPALVVLSIDQLGGTLSIRRSNPSCDSPIQR